MATSASFFRVAILLATFLLTLPAPAVFAAEFSEEVLTRQGLIKTALAQEPADLLIEGPTVLNVFTQEWLPNQDIVIRDKRIAWVGDSGTWPGTAETRIDARK